MSVSAAVPRDHPLMQAWERYAGSDEFENSLRWATQSDHSKGSMWAAFKAGWIACGGPAPFGPTPKSAGTTVYVAVTGLTGSGKSAIYGEIEIALKAIGVPVVHADGAAAQSEKNLTHADWMTALELYRPHVVLTEKNIPRRPRDAVSA